jgi:hypothetical protein
LTWLHRRQDPKTACYLLGSQGICCGWGYRALATKCSCSSAPPPCPWNVGRPGRLACLNLIQGCSGAAVCVPAQRRSLPARHAKSVACAAREGCKCWVTPPPPLVVPTISNPAPLIVNNESESSPSPAPPFGFPGPPRSVVTRSTAAVTLLPNTRGGQRTGCAGLGGPHSDVNMHGTTPAWGGGVKMTPKHGMDPAPKQPCQHGRHPC